MSLWFLVFRILFTRNRPQNRAAGLAPPRISVSFLDIMTIGWPSTKGLRQSLSMNFSAARPVIS